MSSLSNWKRKEKTLEIKNWNFIERIEYIYRQNIYTSFIRAQTHIALYILLPPKREREREREDTRKHTRTYPRQTDQTTPSSSKSSVMQGDHRDDATTTTPHVVNPNGGEKQAEIYTHDAPWLIYACNWSVRCLLFYVCRFRNRESFSSLSFWVFSLSSYARIESDAIRENGYMCHLYVTALKALFFLYLVPRKKTTLTLTKHHSLSRSLVIIINAFFSCVR